MSLFASTRVGLAAALVLSAAAVAAPPVIDGQNIPTEYSGSLLTTQRFQTQFGDDTSGDQFGGGSELDQLYVTNDGVYLYVAYTGNVENNGNACIIWIDTDGGAGVTTLITRTGASQETPVPGLPRFLAGDPSGDQGLDELTFDAGFTPDFALGFSGGSPIGSQTRTYYLVNLTSLDPASSTAHTNQIVGLITAGNPTASGTTPGTMSTFWAGSATLGMLAAADNSNDFGVSGGTALCPDPNLPGDTCTPTSATKGFEFAIPMCALGVDIGDDVRLLVSVSGTTGYLSNQFLPTDTAANLLNNLAFPPFNFATLTGDQFATYSLVANSFCPNDPSATSCDTDIDGNCLIDAQDLAFLLSAFGKSSLQAGFIARADTDNNCLVDAQDLANLLADYGNNCN